jgi:hypothetical protein
VADCEIVRRAGVRIGYGAPIAESTRAITLVCDASDAEWANAGAAMLSSGLLIGLSRDERRRG